MLAISAALMGADEILAVDIDPNAIEQAQENRDDFEDSLPIDFIQHDICSAPDCCPVTWADVVVTNPPFGTRRKGADVAFLQTAFSIAETAVYSLHKRSTRQHLEKVAHRDPRVSSSNVIAELRYNLPALYKFHRHRRT
ncbi:unnamed protein product [Ostreobium quekettii]|uniref:Ribosomal RNA large subunit methyltransferase K/L-like methyltransferase domain-containing protein n=1 Tax=Ostreobium quekettii TaxID=121088 RepID=A0A8S1IUV9_9CHLO|nr:unnamed protein product [Ostreobium quekettii]|eukprot:evm.model.scf_27.18 EVM.evm.TU.scf_27.18   scf_27:141450-142945(+)